jgi:hypothetical protein
VLDRVGHDRRELLAQLVEAVGVDTPVDPTLVETVVASVVAAVAVWLVPNQPAE